MPFRAYEGMADDVSGLLKHLHVDSADVMGYSMDGGIAFKVAVRRPEQVRRTKAAREGAAEAGARREAPADPDPERQEAVVREILRKRGLSRSPRGRALDSEAENRRIIDAFDDAPFLSAKTRAYRLAGGVARWEDEAARRSGLPKSHPLFTGEAPDA
jgi:pimeloyl-ACP methyl ester carboxylesterase